MGSLGGGYYFCETLYNRGESLLEHRQQARLENSITVSEAERKRFHSMEPGLNEKELLELKVGESKMRKAMGDLWIEKKCNVAQRRALEEMEQWRKQHEE